MNEDMVAKFEQFESNDLWVMLVCFKNADRTRLYTYALEALRRTDKRCAARWESRHHSSPEPDGYRVGDGGNILPTSR